MNVALIGTGYWGKKYVSTLIKMKDVNLSWVCTKSSAEKFAPTDTNFTHDYKDILSDKNVECVIVVTPAETHFQIVEDCLLAGKHVLVEKPFTTDSRQASELMCIAMDNNLTLMVGHIYLHSDSIVKIKKIMESGQLGEIKTIFSKRMSVSKHPHPLWEIASHDLYILRYLFDRSDGWKHRVVKIMGDDRQCIFQKEFVNTSSFVLETINAYVEVATDYPGKIRTIEIKGTEKMLLFDDEAHESAKITIIDNKTKEVEFVEIKQEITPLEKQCEHFFKCVKTGDVPIADGYDGFMNVFDVEKVIELL